jgi:hypothetical protein
MNETLYYLVNMPEPLTKQTLCVILDIEEKPKHWEDITKGKFFIINGRYSVGTSIRMQISVLPDEKCRNSCNKIVSLCFLNKKIDSGKYWDIPIDAITSACSSQYGRPMYSGQDSSRTS